MRTKTKTKDFNYNEIRLITIDPGLSGTGIALWSSKKKDEWELECALTKSLPNGQMYLKWLSEVLSEYVIASDVIVCIEEPSLMDSEKGTVAARSGSLVKLAMFAGMIVGLMSIRNYQVVLVPVMSWKGNLPKAITRRRVMSALGDAVESNKASHYYDAIGIGLYSIKEGLAVNI